MSNQFGKRSNAVAWALISLLCAGVGFFAVSVPAAFAQSTSADDSKRYSQLLQTIYQFVLKNYVDEVDPAKLYQGAMKGMLDSLGDPHSFFLDENMLSDLMRESDGEYAGVGLYISKRSTGSKDPEKNWVEVVSPIEDSPAWKSDVQPGDYIVEIDGQSTADMNVDQASAKIRGPAGTTVKLKFLRGSSYEFEITFVRARIVIPSIKSAIIPQPEGAVGYIRIIEWIDSTAAKVEDALAKMKKDGVSRYIVDVRSNPGGLLSSVVAVSDLFLGSGIIVSTRGRNTQENREFKADPSVAIPKGSRLVVLLNKGSASASEIFAGAMKDRKAALLVGETSYGKGSVQQVFPIDETGFKLTMARYYTPSGANIDKVGIGPDVLAPDISIKEDELDALEALYDSGALKAFAAERPKADPSERKIKALELSKQYKLPVVYIDRLLRNELERGKMERVYDLEFDTQLGKALELIASPDFDARLSQSRPLSQTTAQK
ncbi:MAG TPA: S41 family peptidase [Rectinemataceae bacterium]